MFTLLTENPSDPFNEMTSMYWRAGEDRRRHGGQGKKEQTRCGGRHRSLLLAQGHRQQREEALLLPQAHQARRISAFFHRHAQGEGVRAPQEEIG